MAGTGSAKRAQPRDAETKLAHRRLTVLELAERLGNVSGACRRSGIDRASSHPKRPAAWGPRVSDWKRRFQLQGLDGLKDLPPIAKSHPMTPPPELIERTCALALAHRASPTAFC